MHVRSRSYNQVRLCMEAPFEGIIVTAAGLDIPETLLNQLVAGGRLVMSVGGQGEVEQLKVITRNDDMSIDQKDILPVRFIPITKVKGQLFRGVQVAYLNNNLRPFPLTPEVAEDK